MKQEKMASIFSIGMGISMLGMWMMFYITGNIPELESKPIELGMHLLAEIATAIILIIGGIGVIKSKHWGVHIYFISMGMLLYTIPNSAGYFLENKEYGLVIMFGIFLVASLIFLVSMLRIANGRYKNAKN
ncbi:hypothetical protein EDC18_10285 [Natranaerovirga pectinivora]|uniref:DUF8058 domain-containing protein n=1 Tax=Natranaerovirga pectinivora TaxID=682400 RepID=A0A4R3MMA4_9FIRM|nr:hypothetical protein [Natranaerovirga pectinivora]TCT16069.1 hypothetical protein EDC18_10285 [Natranaerovirga pectinivora]